MTTHPARRVVITGMGTVNPIGNDVPSYWDNLLAGKSGVRQAANIDLSDYSIRIAAEVDMPDVGHLFTNRRLIRRLDRFAIFAHVAACEALVHSGLEPGRAPHRYGVIIGTGDAGLSMQETHIQNMLDKGMHRVSPYYVSSHIPNTAPALFAVEKNLQGPNFSVNSACATSNHAIGIAWDLLRAGAADAIFAGGAEAVITRMSIAGFGNIHALSERNDDPATASRPFDRDRDGFVIGEGAGVVLLEELEHAKKRGATIYGELTGSGFTCDAHDLVEPHPDGAGAKRAMELAVGSAGIGIEAIGLINAHGTSTPKGDLAENISIRSVFGDHADNILVHSTKSMTGHLIGAAGGVEIIAALLAFERNVIHPTINQFERDPAIDLNIVENEPVEKRVDHILSNSFGFGGQNATIVVSRFTG